MISQGEPWRPRDHPDSSKQPPVSPTDLLLSLQGRASGA